MARFFCAVAFRLLDEPACRKICDAMDGRTHGWNALPLGVTRTHWTQKRCQSCKRHSFGCAKNKKQGG